jgi:protein-L-isoaspartate(D-aspartate) O-methyltransferase
MLITMEKHRCEMVEQQLKARGIRDAEVLRAMAQVPREQFVAPHLIEHAYRDKPLPIEESQTISQPFIVALMLQAARLHPEARVLEIGTGSGYAAALMGCLAREVHTVERHGSLAASASTRLRELGYANVQVHAGDGTLGWPDAAPYAAILVAAASPEVPEALRQQLAIQGRLLIPVGSGKEQRLLRFTRETVDRFREDDLGPVMFVPLIGQHGWAETDLQLRGF